MSDGRNVGSAGSKPITAVGGAPGEGSSAPVAEGSMLPPAPRVVPEDLVAALAMMTIEQKRNERANADKQRIASEKAQEEAHAAKIERMTQLAKDTFRQAVVEGVCEGFSAVADAVSAYKGYEGAITPGADGKKMEATGKYWGVASKSTNIVSKFAAGRAKAAQEEDRRDMAICDAALDRAKRAVDAAAGAAKEAQDDINQTINAIRSYLAAKTQLGQAAIIRG